jgi:NADPH:quinone reductase-like Zn-dependent oxidoreductase
VFATVGKDEKIEYLVNELGIPRDHIFSSRDTSFQEDIMQATNGRGVDLVLNSLAGELLHASWQCVAPFGKMLEIGKRDFIGNGSLEMNVFEMNRSYIGIDLTKILDQKPDISMR